MTLDVYNQLLDRRKRDHGTAFDALLASARDTLYKPSPRPSRSAIDRHSSRGQATEAKPTEHARSHSRGCRTGPA
jgi:hypothetical protein